MPFNEDGVLLLPGEFKECLMGFEVHSNVAIYSKDKIIEVLLKNMNYEEALEHFYYNICGSRGEGFPIYLETE